MKKKKMIIVGGIVLLVVILIVIALISYSFISKKNKKVEDSKTKDRITYVCKAKQEETEDYTTYLVEELSVEDSRVMEGTSYVSVVCNNQSSFDELKSSLESEENRVFDDNNLTMKFQDGETSDYTKDVDGKDMSLDYETYQEDLAKVGYECSIK